MSVKAKLLNFDEPLVVAIDGTAASGKGTLAKLMASKFNLVYCQTSLFYRQLALNAIKNGAVDSVEKIIEMSKQRFDLHDSPDLYTPDVTEVASIVASIPEVRLNLIKPQRDFLLANKRIVMEVIDIGTVISPEAERKRYVTADLDIRAERRRNQMLKNSVEVSFEDVRSALEHRDKRDSNREHGPLAKADNAIEIDTTHSAPEEIVEHILSRG